jgi:hypothetical protein
MFIEVTFAEYKKLINLEDVSSFALSSDLSVTLVYRDGSVLMLEETYDDIKRALRNCGEFILE